MARIQEVLSRSDAWNLSELMVVTEGVTKDIVTFFGKTDLAVTLRCVFSNKLLRYP